ncbi:putative quinol monooxygenase [Streptomyces sp. SAI-229]|jgi:quinol monooxygenase YgiN|uniref:putative quinol monooxygenase n=1 Tax=Streptomyces sp. SAI-229 TaxID=3377731 RepID=UPI003C7A9465
MTTAQTGRDAGTTGTFTSGEADAGTHQASETPVVLLARMHARPGREQELQEALVPLVTATHQEPGCVAYEPHRGHDDPALFVMHEIWQSEAHLRAHEQSAHLREFAEKAASLTDGGIAIERLEPLGVTR